jgi:hypothetical protein
MVPSSFLFSLPLDFIKINLINCKTNLGEVKPMFSGKHKLYCIKSEVGHAPLSVLAMHISSGHPGARHDFNIYHHHTTEQRALPLSPILEFDQRETGCGVVVCVCSVQRAKLDQGALENH